jgi:hypothetical protein
MKQPNPNKNKSKLSPTIVKHMTPKKWINRIFESKIAKDGGIVRRSLASIDKFASRKALVHEINRREYHAVQVGEQCVIICNQGQINLML